MTQGKLLMIIDNYKQGLTGRSAMVAAVEGYTSALLQQCNVSKALALLEQELHRINTHNREAEEKGENYNCLNTLRVKQAIQLLEKLSANVC